MQVRIALVISLLVSIFSIARADTPHCTDHPLIPTRMPGYTLVDCKTAEFDGYDFFGPKGTRHHEEGKFTFLTYGLEKGQTESSALAIVRNYQNAITKIGGTIANTDPNWVNGKVVVDGREVWIQVERGNGRIWLRIIEKTAMVQHIVADAAAFATDLKTTGHVAVEGIYFDTGKSVLKPESTPALDEIAKLMTADASLRLWVVGHTDSVGKLDDNVKLAQARAEAVVAALTTTHKIAAARLSGHGMGPLAPVASNDTEAGRAKNRRVELVKQP